VEYTLDELQKLYGRRVDAVSRNAKPLNLERLNSKWKPIVEEAIRFIVNSYNKDRTPLTVRQVHYHLVHEPIGYRNDLKHGLIGWEMISEEESTVFHNAPAGADPEEAIKEALEAAKYTTGKNPWEEMGKYVLVLTEKRELGPQLKSIADKYFVRLVCVRGYGMWSRLYIEGLLISEALEKDLEPYVLFVTDNYWNLPIEDIRVMLTIDQVKNYNLPPAPTKVKDPRAKWYIKAFGNDSWEVDALGKEGMQKMLEESIQSLIDWDIWNKVMKENEENMRRTEEIAKKFLEGGEYS